MNHSFNVEHAQAYGVGEAILIHHFVFWIAKNKANGKHFHDGRTWTYSSSVALSDLLPYYSKDQIDRLIKSLKDQGVILTGNFNKLSTDKTRWFAFADENLFLSGYQFDEKELEKRRELVSRNREIEIAESLNRVAIPLNGKAKSPDGYSEIATPIPDNKTYSKTDKRASPATALNIPFESFWDLYDKKRDRPACEKKWAALTDAERQAVITHLPAYVRSTPDKKFRRDPATYLNNRSWENEIISPLPTPVTPNPVYTPPKWKTGADWN